MSRDGFDTPPRQTSTTVRVAPGHTTRQNPSTHGHKHGGNLERRCRREAIASAGRDRAPAVAKPGREGARPVRCGLSVSIWAENRYSHVLKPIPSERGDRTSPVPNRIGANHFLRSTFSGIWPALSIGSTASTRSSKHFTLPPRKRWDDGRSKPFSGARSVTVYGC